MVSWLLYLLPNGAIEQANRVSKCRVYSYLANVWQSCVGRVPGTLSRDSLSVRCVYRAADKGEGRVVESNL